MSQQSWQPANLSPNAEDNKALQRHIFVFFVISWTMTSQGRSENSDQSRPLHPMLPNADLPKTKTKLYGDRSLAARAPRLWNALPVDIKKKTPVLLVL